MLDQLTRRPGSRNTGKRLGRGIGSGKGRTCGRGQKGAGARSGHKKRPWSEGGQMPLSRRLPKRGFHNPFRVRHQPINVKQLAELPKGSEVTVASLQAAGLVPRVDRPVKLLAEGELSVALHVKLDAVSAAARQKVEAAGGTVELVATRARKGGEAPETS